jgi:hypothetical protein
MPEKMVGTNSLESKVSFPIVLQKQVLCRKLQKQKAIPFYLQLPADFHEIKQNQHETQLEVSGMYSFMAEINGDKNNVVLLGRI